MGQAIIRFFSPIPPNLITTIGGILALVGTYCFHVGHNRETLWTGFIALTLSFLTDALDGGVARYWDKLRSRIGTGTLSTEEELKLGFLKRFLHKGSTLLGKSWDPFIDKLRFIPLMWVLGYSHANELLMNLVSLMAIALTIQRARHVHIGVTDGGSNWLGKKKMQFEVGTIVVFAFGLLPLGPGGTTLILFIAKGIGIDITHLLPDSMFMTQLRNLLLLGCFLGACGSYWGHHTNAQEKRKLAA